MLQKDSLLEVFKSSVQRGLASIAKSLGYPSVALSLYRSLDQKGELAGASLRKASKLAFRQGSWLASFEYGNKQINQNSSASEFLDVAIKAGWAGEQQSAAELSGRALLAKPDLVGWPRMHAGIVLSSNGAFSKGCRVMSECLRSQDTTLMSLISKGEEREAKELIYLAPDAGIGSSVIQALPILLDPDSYKKSVLVVDQRLHSVFSRVMPNSMVFRDQNLDAADGPFNIRTGYDLLSGSTILSQKVESVLLYPDAEKSESCLSRYKNMFGGKRLIGLAWYTPNPRTGRYRNINLPDLKELLGTNSDCVFISLQPVLTQAHRDKELIGCPNLFVDDEINPIVSIEDQLAQIAVLDHVITIDCTAAFFAGALGKRCDILLSGEPTWQWPEGDSLFANQQVHKSIKNVLL